LVFTGWTPDVTQEEFVCEYAVWVVDEEQEQVELLGCEVGLYTADFD
jgi:hypothetical protein